MQVVITGSSRGLGLALAREFLRLGDSVVISSRSADHCGQAHEQLLKDNPRGTVLAEPCDVTQPEEVRWALSQQHSCAAHTWLIPRWRPSAACGKNPQLPMLMCGVSSREYHCRAQLLLPDIMQGTCENAPKCWPMHLSECKRPSMSLERATRCCVTPDCMHISQHEPRL